MPSLLYGYGIGPLVNLFEPDRYATSWILDGNGSADEVCWPKRNINDDEHTYQNMWSLMNQKQRLLTFLFINDIFIVYNEWNKI